MKNKLALLLMKPALALLITIAYSEAHSQQTIFPQGGYKNLMEVNEKKPSGPFQYRIRERPDEEIEKYGENDYDGEFQEKGAVKWHREKKLYAISDGKSLYLNGRSFDLPVGYMLVIEEGKYLIFLCATPPLGRVGKSSTGTIIIDPWKHVGYIRKKMYYCLDTTTGSAKILDKLFISEKLTNYPDLASEFEEEPENTSIEVALKYIRLLNLK